MDAYSYIKKEIITGNLLPGSIFNEADIISKLKVSRTPVREAVLKLASEGYLTIIPRKGTIISNISFSDVSQVYEYRLMLEPEICSKAAPIMDKILCLKWKEYFNNLLLNKKSKPPVNDSDDDIDKLFHLSISQSLNNNLINKDIAHLMDLSQRIRFLSNKQNEQRYIASINEHISILDAIIKEDSNLAREMMKQHLKNTVEGY